MESNRASSLSRAISDRVGSLQHTLVDSGIKMSKTSRKYFWRVFYVYIGFLGVEESISDAIFGLRVVMTSLVVIAKWSSVVN